eukprot:TRINITY_DN27389_c0_g2_i2.p4 TRINITY_DN27389_c0_g2~~TRINITY_DN27389_c0_g2_i2.p4  ORF type:complete len:107 (-),score=1.93 TRINITY_DN27389_c0_g2_i2:449-769(-)
MVLNKKIIYTELGLIEKFVVGPEKYELTGFCLEKLIVFGVLTDRIVQLTKNLHKNQERTVNTWEQSILTNVVNTTPWCTDKTYKTTLLCLNVTVHRYYTIIMIEKF